MSDFIRLPIQFFAKILKYLSIQDIFILLELNNKVLFQKLINGSITELSDPPYRLMHLLHTLDSLNCENQSEFNFVSDDYKVYLPNQLLRYSNPLQYIYKGEIPYNVSLDCLKIPKNSITSLKTVVQLSSSKSFLSFIQQYLIDYLHSSYPNLKEKLSLETFGYLPSNWTSFQNLKFLHLKGSFVEWPTIPETVQVFEIQIDNDDINFGISSDFGRKAKSLEEFKFKLTFPFNISSLCYLPVGLKSLKIYLRSIFSCTGIADLSHLKNLKYFYCHDFKPADNNNGFILPDGISYSHIYNRYDLKKCILNLSTFQSQIEFLTTSHSELSLLYNLRVKTIMLKYTVFKSSELQSCAQYVILFRDLETVIFSPLTWESDNMDLEQSKKLLCNLRNASGNPIKFLIATEDHMIGQNIYPEIFYYSSGIPLSSFDIELKSIHLEISEQNFKTHYQLLSYFKNLTNVSLYTKSKLSDNNFKKCVKVLPASVQYLTLYNRQDSNIDVTDSLLHLTNLRQLKLRYCFASVLPQTVQFNLDWPLIIDLFIDKSSTTSFFSSTTYNTSSPLFVNSPKSIEFIPHSTCRTTEENFSKLYHFLYEHNMCPSVSNMLHNIENNIPLYTKLENFDNIQDKKMNKSNLRKLESILISKKSSHTIYYFLGLFLSMLRKLEKVQFTSLTYWELKDLRLNFPNVYCSDVYAVPMEIMLKFITNPKFTLTPHVLDLKNIKIEIPTIPEKPFSSLASWVPEVILDPITCEIPDIVTSYIIEKENQLLTIKPKSQFQNVYSLKDLSRTRNTFLQVPMEINLEECDIKISTLPKNLTHLKVNFFINFSRFMNLLPTTLTSLSFFFSEQTSLDFLLEIPNLKRLAFWWNKESVFDSDGLITNNSLKHNPLKEILSKLPNVEHISLNNKSNTRQIYWFPNSTLEMPNLTSLDLSNWKLDLTETAISKFPTHLKQLKLDMTNHYNLIPIGILKTLAKLPIPTIKLGDSCYGYIAKKILEIIRENPMDYEKYFTEEDLKNFI